MLFKKFPLLICASLAPCMVFAQDNTDSVIDAFLECDNQFFQKLTEDPTSLNEYVDLAKTDDGIAYIPVEDVEKNDKNTVMFKTPIQYKGLTITGYQNIYIETPLLGQYYYWGFIMDNSVDDVKSALNQNSWMQYNSATYISNAKIYDRQSKPAIWQNNPYAIDGTIPKLWTVEKSLYLEPISEKQVHLVCSIQGDLDKDILYATRPDMKPVDEKIEAKRQEMIKEYKLKRQKEKEKQAQEQEKANTESSSEQEQKPESKPESKQESTDQAVDNTAKEGEQI